MLQARPTLTPDQVKALLMSTADPLVQNPNPAMGAGVIDIAGALTATVPSTDAASLLPESTGTGSLEASRGGVHVLDPANGVVLSGEVDALGSPWNAAAWSAASSRGTAWSGGTWNGRVWTGNAWAKDDWKPAIWTGDSWSGIAWSSYRMVRRQLGGPKLARPVMGGPKLARGFLGGPQLAQRLLGSPQLAQPALS